MSAPTFAEALTQAEALARAKYPDRAERITQAVALVRGGKVLQRDDHHTWDVASTTTPGKVYSLNGAGCPCADSHYRGAVCKHQMAVFLARKAMQLLGPQAPTQAPQAEPVAAPLPEAPASATAKVMLGAYEVLLTVRDTDAGRLLDTLQGLLWDRRIQPVPKPAPRAQGQGKQRQYQGR